MNKTTKYIGSLIAGLLTLTAVCVIPMTTGCNTISPYITDTNKIVQVSNYLEQAVSFGVAYGIKQDTNTVTYANLAYAAINEVIAGKDYTPGALATAINKLPVAVLQTPAAMIITDSIESIYQIYWESDVNGAVNGNFAALTYLEATQTGIQAGLNGKAPSLLTYRKLVRPAVKK